jgi:hypothetical protein
MQHFRKAWKNNLRKIFHKESIFVFNFFRKLPEKLEVIESFHHKMFKAGGKFNLI